MEDSALGLRLASDSAEQYLLDRILDAEGRIIGWARAGAPGGHEEAERLIADLDDRRKAWERFKPATTIEAPAGAVEV